MVLLGAFGALRSDKAAALPPCTGCGDPKVVSRDACGQPVTGDPAWNPMGSPYYSHDRSLKDANVLVTVHNTLPIFRAHAVGRGSVTAILYKGARSFVKTTLLSLVMPWKTLWPMQLCSVSRTWEPSTSDERNRHAICQAVSYHMRRALRRNGLGRYQEQQG